MGKKFYLEIEYSIVAHIKDKIYLAYQVAFPTEMLCDFVFKTFMRKFKFNQYIFYDNMYIFKLYRESKSLNYIYYLLDVARYFVTFIKNIFRIEREKIILLLGVLLDIKLGLDSFEHAGIISNIYFEIKKTVRTEIRRHAGNNNFRYISGSDERLEFAFRSKYGKIKYEVPIMYDPANKELNVWFFVKIEPRCNNVYEAIRQLSENVVPVEASFLINLASEIENTVEAIKLLI